MYLPKPQFPFHYVVLHAIVRNKAWKWWLMGPKLCPLDCVSYYSSMQGPLNFGPPCGLNLLPDRTPKLALSATIKCTDLYLLDMVEGARGGSLPCPNYSLKLTLRVHTKPSFWNPCLHYFLKSNLGPPPPWIARFLYVVKKHIKSQREHQILFWGRNKATPTQFVFSMALVIWYTYVYCPCFCPRYKEPLK